MAEQFYTILTQIGKAKIANASTLGNKIKFTYFALGDGNGSYYNPIESQQALKNEVWRGQIGNVMIDENNPSWIVLETIIPADQGGFMIREAGVFDDEGNMLAIGKYPETYKPIVSAGSAKDLYVRMILEVSNTSVVNLKLDPSIILATKKDIDILSNRIKKNADDILELKKGTTIIEELQTENKTLSGAINELKENKVDKVQGKWLSTNDYTTAEKNKLAGIPVGGGTPYEHPPTHPASMIIEVENKRFMTDAEKDKLANIPMQSVPKGIIVMWSGTVASIPVGWILCDGTNDTPNLKDRFIMGGTTDGTINKTGGQNEVTLTESQIPKHIHIGSVGSAGSHSHIVHGYETSSNGNVSNMAYGSPSYGIGKNFSITDTAGSHVHSLSIGSTGGGLAHENRPAYYTLAFIMKL
ncbi:phage tail protein [Tissierella carlieri]|uniref:phage tail-collar fiber domain-containing protein n=1 Tax=Tissierella carlieri TaxID=689904 RepID=UPI0038680C8F